MFRIVIMLSALNHSFPRIRGDVPAATFSNKARCAFSPHTRGCSGHLREAAAEKLVFPAYAGMFLAELASVLFPACFPRIRGDVPLLNTAGQQVNAFSPHTRGCSDRPYGPAKLIPVFPAYAGMFLPEGAIVDLRAGFPRIRGDVPADWPSGWDWSGFSPHTRGCSVVHLLVRFKPCVFPAYAGMFRPSRQGTRGFCGFPRIRGDVPMFLHLPIKTP